MPTDSRKAAAFKIDCCAEDSRSSSPCAVPLDAATRAWTLREADTAEVVEGRAVELDNSRDVGTGGRGPFVGIRRRPSRISRLTVTSWALAVASFSPAPAIAAAMFSRRFTWPSFSTGTSTRFSFAGADAAAKEKRVEVPVLKDGQVKRLENIAAAIAGAGEKLATASAQLVTVSREILEGLRRIPTNGHRPPVPTSRLLSSSTARPSTTSAVSASRNVQARVAASSGTAHGEDDRLSSVQQSILNAAAFLESVGIEAPSAG